MNGHVTPESIDPRPAEDFPGGSGLYARVPEDQYHALDGRASSSILRTLLQDSPAHAKASMEADDEPTKAMRFGTMAHQAVLEPDRFEESHAVSTQCWATTSSGSRCSSPGKVPYRTQGGAIIWFCGRSSHQPDFDEPTEHECDYCGAAPSTKCVTASGNPADPHKARRQVARITQTCKGELALEGEADVEQISEQDADRIESMRSVIRARQVARNVLMELPGLSELTALWEHPGTGVLCKSRIDRVVEHEHLGIVAIDYKTTRNAAPGPHEFGRSVMKGRYDVQAAFYMAALSKLGLPPDHFLFVAQEREAPYDVVSHVLLNSSELMDKGHEDMERALRQYKDCAESGEWPGYMGPEDHLTELDVPHWHFDDIRT